MDYNSFANKVWNTLGADLTPYSVSAAALALINAKLGTIGAYVNTAGAVVFPAGISIPAGSTLTLAGDIVPQTQVLSGDGAITIKSGIVIITKTSAAAITLAAPTATTDDGKTLKIESTTAQAHTVTNTSPGFNGGSTASDVATWATAIGNSIELIAYQGTWYTFGTAKGVTLG